MKILHTVEFYSPSVGGAQEVVKQISERLVDRGHSVTVATTKLTDRKTASLNGVHIAEFDIAGNAVRGFRGEFKRYHQFLIENRFDVMMNYAAQQWTTDLAFPVLRKIPYAKVFAPCGFSSLFDSQYGAYFYQLPEAMRSYDHLIFHSNVYRDIKFARQHGLNSYVVIPNGASEEEFQKVDSSFRQQYGIPEDFHLLLTVGSHTGSKGHSLVIEAFRRADLERSVLVIIGNRFGHRGCSYRCKGHSWWVNLTSGYKKQVILLDPPRSEVVAAYHAADLFVFGSHIECSPLVLFESMASRTPFITTACGNAEEIVEWGSGGIIVPTMHHADGTVSGSPRVMANIIEDLLRSPEKRRVLGENGYKAWRARFTWEKITHLYEDLYFKAADSSRASS